MKIKFFKNRKVNGYTLVETLVAISIFSVSILGLLVMLSQGIADTGYAKKKMTAAYLAQEGVEYVRNMRDTIMIYDPSGDPEIGWNELRDTHLDLCKQTDGCFFNPADPDTGLVYGNPDRPMLTIAIESCLGPNPDGCPELLYHPDSGKYDYTSPGDTSGFRRKIRIEQVSVDELKVTSTVFWTQGSGDYHMDFSENLFKWIE